MHYDSIVCDQNSPSVHHRIFVPQSTANSSSPSDKMGQKPVLIIFSGLPGTGKTTLARALAQQFDSTYLRIDTIEHAIRGSKTSAAPLYDEGYCVANAVAEDNLRLGRSVIADAVNAVRVAREAWRAVAARTGAKIVEVEVICSDLTEHQRRVESRQTDIAGMVGPHWQAVRIHEYHSWDREHIVIDTAHRSLEENLAEVSRFLFIL